MIGDANASCGQYVQAVDDERKARPPHAYPNAVYDINYQAYPSAAEGFLSGANALDPVHSLVGQGTDTQGRMAWLENIVALNRWTNSSRPCWPSVQS